MNLSTATRNLLHTNPVPPVLAVRRSRLAGIAGLILIGLLGAPAAGPACAAAPATAQASEATRPGASSDRVERIVIDRLPVFPETTDVPNPWYMELVNRLHVQTRTYVIRRELLFVEGSTVDSTRIVESERLLRDRGIFESVRVSTSPGDSGRVATVTAQDLWTLGVIANFSKTADIVEATFGIRDTNFLGTGNFVHAYHTFSSDQDVTVASLAFPRIANSRAGASMGFADQEDARSYSAFVGRGIESRFDRSSWGAVANASKGSQRFFSSGEEVGKSPYEREQYGIYGARFRGDGPQTGLGLGWIEQRETPRGEPISLTPGYDPPPPVGRMHVGGPTLFVGLLDRTYATAVNLARYGSIEDVPTGWSAHFGVVPNLHYHDDPGHMLAFRSVLQVAQFLSPTVETGAEVSGLAFIRDGGDSGEQVAHAVGTVRWAPTRQSITVAQGFVTGGRDRPESDIYYIGSESGLRGFPSREFTARSMVQATFEQRFWTGWEILWTGIGAEIFADTARPSLDCHFDTEPWRTGWGVGMLLGFRKSSRDPVRIEVAWRTDRQAAPTFSLTMGSWLRTIPPLGFLFPVGDIRNGLR